MSKRKSWAREHVAPMLHSITNVRMYLIGYREFSSLNGKYQLKLTGFYIAGSPVNSETKSNDRLVTDGPVIETDHYCVSYLDNTFSLEFSLLDFVNPESIIFEYRINDGEWQKYTTSLTNNEACTIKTYCTAEGLLDSPLMSYDFDLFINKSGWKLVSVDSYQGGNEAAKAFDNNTSTFWHTAWGANEPRCPHTIVIDMTRIYQVTAFTYTARTDGNANGMVKAYEVYLSLDGKTWGNPVATGEFKNTTAMQIAKLKTATAGRYLKFVAKSEINNNAWTSASELGIQAAADVTAVDEVYSPVMFDDENYYTLQGVATATPSHGVYVYKGRKVLF